MPVAYQAWSSAIDGGPKQKAFEDFVRQADGPVGAFLEFDPARPCARDADRPDEGYAPGGAAEKLKGLPFAVKDNIAVENFRLSCGSKMLGDFVAPYTATCVARLARAGAKPVGKTNLDEFGMGSSCDNSALKKTNNPWDLSRVAGGSSGGSAAAVAAGFVPFAIGTDTGGSVREPAAFCGVYGLKPTYGAVPRYGLVAYASSLECAGVLARSIDLAEAAFLTMRGVDGHDHTSLPSPAYPAPTAVRKVAVLKGRGGLSPAIEQAMKAAADALRAKGVALREVEMPSLEYVVPAYYTIATAEASSNLARFTGVGYGRRTDYAENPEELIRKSRSEGFGDEVKLRILLGTYVLRSGFQARYYQKAQKIRTEIRNELGAILKDDELLMLPVFPTQAFPHGDAGMDQFQQKVADMYTCMANLSGSPAISVPAGVAGGLPSAVQFIAPAFREDRLFAAARALEEALPLASPPSFSEEFLK